MKIQIVSYNIQGIVVDRNVQKGTNKVGIKEEDGVKGLNVYLFLCRNRKGVEAVISIREGDICVSATLNMSCYSNVDGIRTITINRIWILMNRNSLIKRTFRKAKKSNILLFVAFILLFPSFFVNNACRWRYVFISTFREENIFSSNSLNFTTILVGFWFILLKKAVKGEKSLLANRRRKNFNSLVNYYTDFCLEGIHGHIHSHGIGLLFLRQGPVDSKRDDGSLFRNFFIPANNKGVSHVYAYNIIKVLFSQIIWLETSGAIISPNVWQTKTKSLLKGGLFHIHVYSCSIYDMNGIYIIRANMTGLGEGNYGLRLGHSFCRPSIFVFYVSNFLPSLSRILENNITIYVLICRS